MAKSWAGIGFLVLFTAWAWAEPLTGSLWTVDQQGWYTLTAKADGAASLAVVDKRAGTLMALDLDEDVGTWSGRTALLLEPGQYQLRWTKAAGVKASVDAGASRLANAKTVTDAPSLGPQQTVRSTLSDGQSMAFWVTVSPESPRLTLEVRGRSLARVVLWREGVWDMGLNFHDTTREISPGRSLGYYDFDQDVPAGRYLVWAFGGPKLAWGNEAGDEVFVASRGGAGVSGGGVREGTLDPEGRAEWLLGPGSEYVQMEALSPGAFVLQSGPGRFNPAYDDRLTEKQPIRLLSRQISNQRWTVIQGPPGARYRLRVLSSPNSGFLAMVPPAKGMLALLSKPAQNDDGYPSTGLVVTQPDKARQNSVVVWEKTLSVGSNQPLRLTTNNRAASAVLIHVRNAGSYAVVEKGDQNSAEYQFTLLDDLQGFSSKPQVAKQNGSVNLQEKIYLVTSTPIKAGRTDWVLVPAGISQGLAAAGLWDKPLSVPADVSAFVAPKVADARTLQLLLPGREGVPSGASMLSLPLDAENLPSVPVAAATPLQFPVTFAAGRSLTWTGAVQVSLDGKVWTPGAAVPAGEHTLSLSAPVATTFEPTVAPVTTLPAPDAYRSLKPGDTLYDDWARGQTRSYELSVPQAGLYRLETLGRLVLSLQVRTPLQPRLFEAYQQDAGNARLYAYLNPGSYRVQVTSQSGTQGRAGLTLSVDNNPVERSLFPGTLARATVPGDRLLRLDIPIATAADYLITSSGLRQAFTQRLEDADGYPVAAPLSQGSGRFRLSAGTYSLYSYPLPVDSRRVYGLETVTDRSVAADTSAFGWNRTVQSTWKESPDRTPQEFSLTATAPVRAQILLDKGMVYEVLGPDNQSLDRGPGGKPVEIDLPQGKIRFLIRSQAVDNLKDYQLRVSTRDLTPGRSIAQVPGSPVPLAVGQEGTYELSTWGRNEVPLLLYNEDGTSLLASGTPRTDDWNSVLTASLKPGRYLLSYAPLNGPAAQEVPAPEVSDAPDPNADQPSYDEGDSGGDYESDSEGDYDGGDDSAPDVQYDDDGNPIESYSEDDSPPLEEPPAQPWESWTEAHFPGDQGEAPLLTFASRPEVKNADVSVSGKGSTPWGASIRVTNFTTGDAGVYRFASDADRSVVFRIEKDGATLAQSPGGFLIPLLAKTTYRVVSWWEDPSDRPVAWSFGPATGVQAWKNPSRTSARVIDSGQVLGSPGWEHPLVALPDGWLSTLGADGWWALASGDPMGPVSPVTPGLGSGGSFSVPLGEGGQTVTLDLPQGRVGLLTSRGAGLEVGLMAQAAPVTTGWSWEQARVNRISSLVGVSSGPLLARVWNPAPGAQTRWVDLEWDTYPSTEAKAGTLAGTLPAGQAVVLKSAPKNLRFLLDENLVAFPLGDTGTRPLAAEGQPASGLLSGPGFVIVNRGPDARPWRALPSSEAVPPPLTETAGFETLLPQLRDLTLDVRGAAGSRVSVVTGGADEVRWADATTGLWVPAVEKNGPGGDRWEFPGNRGTLFLSGVRGFAKVWVSPPDKADAAGIPTDGLAKTALGSEGAVLTPGAQAWSFQPPQASFYSIEADGPGVLAVLGSDGKPLASSWSADNRSLLVRLGTQPVTVVARPFAPGGQRGGLRLAALDPQTSGQPLLGPGERQLWPVKVLAPGKVGLAVEAPVDGIQLRLFNPDFTPAASGSLFWRTLAPGTYWLVVEGAAETVKYRPIFLGLEGSRVGVPDDVRASFEQGNAP